MTEQRRKVNSRWRLSSGRYSADRSVIWVHTVKNSDGVRRTVVDSPPETAYVASFQENTGWRKGARVRAV